MLLNVCNNICEVHKVHAPTRTFTHKLIYIDCWYCFACAVVMLRSLLSFTPDFLNSIHFTHILHGVGTFVHTF